MYDTVIDENPYDEEARQFAMLTGDAGEDARYQIRLVLTLHHVLVEGRTHACVRTCTYLGTYRVRDPVGETPQVIKRDIICNRLTCQLIGIVQVKLHRVYIEIWVEMWELGDIPVVVGWLQAEHEADDKGKRWHIGDEGEKVTR